MEKGDQTQKFKYLWIALRRDRKSDTETGEGVWIEKDVSQESRNKNNNSVI